MHAVRNVNLRSYVIRGGISLQTFEVMDPMKLMDYMDLSYLVLLVLVYLCGLDFIQYHMPR